jgi:hypothetical protein
MNPGVSLAGINSLVISWSPYSQSDNHRDHTGARNEDNTLSCLAKELDLPRRTAAAGMFSVPLPELVMVSGSVLVEPTTVVDDRVAWVDDAAAAADGYQIRLDRARRLRR